MVRGSLNRSLYSQLKNGMSMGVVSSEGTRFINASITPTRASTRAWVTATALTIRVSMIDRSASRADLKKSPAELGWPRPVTAVVSELNADLSESSSSRLSMKSLIAVRRVSASLGAAAGETAAPRGSAAPGNEIEADDSPDLSFRVEYVHCTAWEFPLLPGPALPLPTLKAVCAEVCALLRSLMCVPSSMPRLCRASWNDFTIAWPPALYQPSSAGRAAYFIPSAVKFKRVVK